MKKVKSKLKKLKKQNPTPSEINEKILNRFWKKLNLELENNKANYNSFNNYILNEIKLKLKNRDYNDVACDIGELNYSIEALNNILIQGYSE